MSGSDLGLQNRDLDVIFHGLGHWYGSHQWSLRANAPSPLKLRRWLSAPGVEPRAIRDDRGALIGVVAIDRVSEHDGHGRLALLVDPSRTDDVRGRLAGLLGELMSRHGLRKVMLDAYADEMQVEQCLPPGMARVAGRFEDYERTIGGDYKDRLVFEIWSEDLT